MKPYQLNKCQRGLLESALKLLTEEELLNQKKPVIITNEYENFYIYAKKCITEHLLAGLRAHDTPANKTRRYGQVYA